MSNRVDGPGSIFNLSAWQFMQESEPQIRSTPLSGAPTKEPPPWVINQPDNSAHSIEWQSPPPLFPPPGETDPETTVQVIDDFETPEGGEASHGETVSEIAEDSSTSSGDNIDETPTSLTFPDLLSKLDEILNAEPPPDVVNMSLGYTPMDLVSQKLDKIDPNWRQWTPQQWEEKGALVNQIIQESISDYAALEGAYGGALRDKIAELVEQGITVVLAAGNSGGDLALLRENGFDAPGLDQQLLYNGDSPPGVIVVGASTDPTRQHGANAADFSSPSAFVDVAADGEDVGGGHYGTSFSAPQVAALAADMLAVNPDLTPQEIEEIIKQTATPVPGQESALGSGIINREAALEEARRRRTDEGTGATPPREKVNLIDIFQNLRGIEWKPKDTPYVPIDRQEIEPALTGIRFA